MLIVLAACSANPIAAPAWPGYTASPTTAISEPHANTPAGVAAGEATQAPPTLTQPAPPAPPQLSTTPGLVPTPEAFQLPPPPQNRTRYELNATLDYDNHWLAVEERITYTNTTTENLSTIPLVVEALRYPRTFQIGGIFDQDGERLSNYKTQDTTLTLHLPRELAPGETARLSLLYTLALADVAKLPQLRPYPLGYTSVQTNLGDWYPFIPPYSPGAGWLVHPPATYGEHLVYDIADFDVAIRLADRRIGLVIAASAPATTDGEWQRYRLEAARSFAWSASPYYEVVTQTVQVAAGQVALIASYYFPYHAQAGKCLLDTMAQALSVYSGLFGAYPHPMLSGVQADFLDGMEYNGLYFLSTDFYNWHKDAQADFLVTLAAHETAHQWWYGVVGNDQAMQPWLDEALCTYSEHLYYEATSPADLDWWWAYRVNYYKPKGWIDISIYDVPGVAGAYKAYRDPVYLKGALFMEELRALIGEQAFFDSLHAYIQRYAYRQADASGFLAILRHHTNQDLEPLLSKYFGPRR